MSAYTDMTLEELREEAKKKNSKGLYYKCAIHAQEEICRRSGKLQYSNDFIESACDYERLCKQEYSYNWGDDYEDK